MWRLAFGTVAPVVAALSAPVDAGEQALRICLVENLPPLSVHQAGKPDSGFEVALAETLAARLGRPLAIQWIESKLDGDSSPALEANALLSDGRCALVGGYMLTKEGLAAPGFKTARLPGFEGAKASDRRRRVPLGQLSPSRPYLYSPLTIVLGPKLQGRHIAGMRDLVGLHIGIESGTLADEILMLFGNGRLVDDITHLIPGRDDLLGALEKGEFDATLLDLRRFDAYRSEHPNTMLVGSGYYYPIGVNRGYVGLAADSTLLAAVDQALSELQTTGAIANLAAAAGLTYLPPREPAILGEVLTKDLQQE